MVQYSLDLRNSETFHPNVLCLNIALKYFVIYVCCSLLLYDKFDKWKILALQSDYSIFGIKNGNSGDYCNWKIFYGFGNCTDFTSSWSIYLKFELLYPDDEISLNKEIWTVKLERFQYQK
jgi:hypothetical protein